MLDSVGLSSLSLKGDEVLKEFAEWFALETLCSLPPKERKTEWVRIGKCHTV